MMMKMKNNQSIHGKLIHPNGNGSPEYENLQRRAERRLCGTEMGGLLVVATGRKRSRKKRAKRRGRDQSMADLKLDWIRGQHDNQYLIFCWTFDTISRY